MKRYVNVTDLEYKCVDVTIYEHEDGTCTCDIKHVGGELIKGREGLDNFMSACLWAGRVIDGWGE